jgi:HK97 gp10 family phage protein
LASVTVSVAGLSELGRNLSELKTAVAQRICRTATNKGAQVVKAQAITNAPAWPVPHKLQGVIVPPGNLKANIVVKKIKSPLTAEYIVTVRGKKKDFFAARYGRLVEFGTVKMAPESYLRKAFDSEKEKAAQTIIAELEAGIMRQVLKSPALAASIKEDLGI